MRVSFVYVMLMVGSISMLLAEDVKGQSIDTLRVTVEMNNETLPQLFDKIKVQTGLLFGYRQGEIEPIAPFTFAKQTASVKAILDLVLINTNLQYKQVNNNVLVFEREPVTTPVTQQPVTGTVKDKKGTPIPGVNILVKGTNIGTSTDAEGKYSIDVPPRGPEGSGDYFLVFTFIGYKKIEEPLNGRIWIDIVMEDEANVLQEVTISGGYYETTNKLKTGSIVKVTAKDIENQPVTSPLMALLGRVPGLEITPATGAPGAAPLIRIRGNNSLRISRLRKGNQVDLWNGVGGTATENDGNYPLYIINGVPVNSAPIQFSAMGDNSMTIGGYDPLSTINPNDIESIEILKDGDATSLYGSRGANGVILITTKRSKNTDRTEFNLSAYRGVGIISRRVEMLNTRQYLDMRREALANGGLTPSVENAPDIMVWDTTRFTDWQKELLGGTSHITDLSGGISYGTKNTSFNIGAAYHKETLIYSTDFGSQRGTGNMSINHSSANDKFRISGTVSYGLDKGKLFNGDFVTAALTLPPNAPKIYNSDGSFNWAIIGTGNSARESWQNPIAWTLQTQNASTRNLIASSNLSYEVFPGLKISTNLGLSDLVSSIDSKVPIISQPIGSGIKYVGRASFNDTRRTTWNIEPMVSFTRQINAHSINVLAGGTWLKNTGNRKETLGDQYLSDALLGTIRGAGTVFYIDNIFEYKYVSAFARIGYTFKQKYIVNLSARRDGSSRFGPSNRFANFGSVGAAWIFSEESFMKNTSFLTFGKIRASYGVTGNDNVGDYMYYNTYDVTSDLLNRQVIFSPSALYNPDFSWESTIKLEGAIEFSLFQNRISSEIGWYLNRSSKQLVDYALPTNTGFASVLENTPAVVENTGLEIMVRGDVLSTNNVRWNIGFNVSLPRNKLVEFDGLEDSPYATRYKVGESTNIVWLHKYKGVNPETGLHEYEDRNNDGEINDADRRLVDALGQRISGGLNNSLAFKDFEISFLLRFTFGNQQRAFTGTPGTLKNQPVWVLDRWQKSGDRTNIQRFISGANYTPEESIASAWWPISDYAVTDGTFFRLQTLSLSYKLPVEWITSVKLEQAKIFLQAQNLFTITKYKGLDPETGNALPQLLMVTAGVQLKF